MEAQALDLLLRPLPADVDREACAAYRDTLVHVGEMLQLALGRLAVCKQSQGDPVSNCSTSFSICEACHLTE